MGDTTITTTSPQFAVFKPGQASKIILTFFYVDRTFYVEFVPNKSMFSIPTKNKNHQKQTRVLRTYNSSIRESYRSNPSSPPKYLTD